MIQRKLTATIICILFCTGALPALIHTSTTASPTTAATQTTDQAVVTCRPYGLPGARTTQVTMTAADATALQQMISTLQASIARDPGSDRTRQLQNDIIVFAQDHGLLPAGSATTIAETLNRVPKSIPFSTPLPQARAAEFFCNFATTGTGGVFPLIVLPRLIPIIQLPIPRLFILWSTDEGVTSVGGLISRTGFIAGGQQKGVALGFWGIGFSIFLPPLAGYGLIGYALYTRVTADEIEYWPPNNPPVIAGTDPADGQTFVPITTSELKIQISDKDKDLMNYNVTTDPDIGSGAGGLKPDGIYSIPISGLQESTTYTWHITLDDGKDTVESTRTFTTEPVSPVVSNPQPPDGATEVPMDIAALQVTLRDYQGDKMTYTVQTSPDVGSGGGSNVGDGTYSIPIHGCSFGTAYHWYVNVTDGTHWTRKVYAFDTGYPSHFNPFDFGWTYCRPLTINHSSIPEDLTDFPVFVHFLDANLSGKTQIDGGDFLFMNGPGVASRLDHELETYDHSAGDLSAFVRIPLISSTMDTTVYLYYGNPNCLDREHPQGVWNSHFKGVWHLNNDPSDGVIDSTSYANNGTSPTMSTANIINGPVGKCYTFDGINDYVTVPDSAVLRPTEVTLLAWMKVPTATQYRWLLGKACTDIWGNKDAISYGLNYHTDVMDLGATAEKDDNGESFVGGPAALSTWYYSGMVFHAATQIIDYYQDGVLQLSMSHGQQLRYEGPWDFLMGAGHTGTGSGVNFWANCQIDEVWVADTALPASWISILYTNQNDPAAFVMVGPEFTD